MNWKDRVRNSIKNAQDQSQGKARGVWFGFVSRQLANERVEASFHGAAAVHWNHPHHGMNSWIRTAPEEGAGMLLTTGQDTKTPYMLGTHLPQATEKRLEGYRGGRNTYRPLKPGEIDIQSSGRAGAFFSDDGELQLRGGVVRGHLSQPEAEVQFRAPTVRLGSSLAQHDTTKDEIRFGVVKRPGIRHSEIPRYARVGTEFAKEYSRNLQSKRNGGMTLVDYREGDVIQDSGKADMNSETGYPNRVHGQYFNEAGVATHLEIDENGSTVYTLAPTAQVFSLNLGTAAFNMKFGGDRVESVSGRNTTVTGKHHLLNAGGNLQLLGGRTATLAGKRKVNITGGGTWAVNLPKLLADRFAIATTSAQTVNILGNIIVNVNSTGALTAVNAVGSKIVFDGVAWDHTHMTGTGMSGPAQTNPTSATAVAAATAAGVAMTEATADYLASVIPAV